MLEITNDDADIRTVVLIRSVTTLYLDRITFLNSLGATTGPDFECKTPGLTLIISPVTMHGALETD